MQLDGFRCLDLFRFLLKYILHNTKKKTMMLLRLELPTVDNFTVIFIKKN